MRDQLSRFYRYWRRVFFEAWGETTEHWLGSSLTVFLGTSAVILLRSGFDALNASPGKRLGKMFEIAPSWSHMGALIIVALIVIGARMAAIPARRHGGPLSADVVIEEQPGASWMQSHPQHVSVYLPVLIHNRNAGSFFVRFNMGFLRKRKLLGYSKIKISDNGDVTLSGMPEGFQYSRMFGVEIPGGWTPQRRQLSRTFSLRPEEREALGDSPRLWIKMTRLGDDEGEVREYERRTTSEWGRFDLVLVAKYLA